MTYSLRGSYIHEKHSALSVLPRQSGQLNRVSVTVSKSCMSRIRPRKRCASSQRDRSEADAAKPATADEPITVERDIRLVRRAFCR